MPLYRAAETLWIKPDGCASARHIEAGEEFSYSGLPSVPMIPLDAAAIQAKRRTLPDSWPLTATPGDTMRRALGLGASPTSNLAERRRILERFIESNPINEGQNNAA